MSNVKGLLCAMASAVTFGLIPLFSLPLIKGGLGFNSILTNRFLIAAVLMTAFMFAKKQTFVIRRTEFLFLVLLSLLYDGSAYFLFWSYKFLSSGVSTSIQMVYPVFVMMIMTAVFKERKTVSMVAAVVFAVSGVALFSYGEYHNGANLAGVALSLAGSLCYAVYIVVINTSLLKFMDNLKLNMYVILLSGLFFLFIGGLGGVLQAPGGFKACACIFMLALFATVVPNITLVVGIKKVGSIITSIMGAFSPVTAVLVGIFVFGESFTPAIAAGLSFVFASVFIIIFARPIDGHIKGILNLMLQHLGLRVK
jgi:drug/metabolite transporter (DMT)-like permease